MVTKLTRYSSCSPIRKNNGHTKRYVWLLAWSAQFMRYNAKDVLTVQCVAVPHRSLLPKILPLYFPRNKAEQYRAVPLLPEDVGNESGETVVAERQVRVGESYQGAAAGGASGLPAPTGYEHDEWLEPEVDPTMVSGGEGGAHPELARYLQLLEAAKEMDLKYIEDKKIMYRAGKDSTGLPVRTQFTPPSPPCN